MRGRRSPLSVIASQRSRECAPGNGLAMTALCYSLPKAGESHVREAKLLPLKGSLILRVSPDSRGDCFGQLCGMLFAFGRSSEEPSTARSDRDAVDCAAGHAVLCNQQHLG